MEATKSSIFQICPECKTPLPEHKEGCAILVRVEEEIRRKLENRENEVKRMFASIDGEIDSFIGNNIKKPVATKTPETIKTPIAKTPEAIKTPVVKTFVAKSTDYAPPIMPNDFKLNIVETKSDFHDATMEEAAHEEFRPVSGANELKCRECEFITGHANNCSIGIRELQEWSQSFGAVTYEEYDDDGKPFMAPIERIEVVEPERYSSKLSKEHELVKMLLINDVLKPAYNFATTGGKIKLDALMKEMKEKPKSISKLLTQNVFETLKGNVSELWTDEERALHIEKMKNFINYQFQKIYDERKLADGERKEILFHLIREMDEAFKDIELKDAGSTRIIKIMVAKMFLTETEFMEIVHKL